MYRTDCLVIVMVVLCVTQCYSGLLSPYGQFREDSSDASNLETGLSGKASGTIVESRGLPSDSTCVLEAEPDKLDIKRHESGLQYEERNKRSTSALIKELIRQSHFWHTYRGTMVFTRPGGYSQALKDFYNLKPTSIREWGDGDKFGFVGDKTVTLIRDPDRASLSFWSRSSYKPDENLLHEKILYQYE